MHKFCMSVCHNTFNTCEFYRLRAFFYIHNKICSCTFSSARKPEKIKEFCYETIISHIPQNGHYGQHKKLQNRLESSSLHKKKKRKYKPNLTEEIGFSTNNLWSRINEIIE